jgi:hypothetical protein
MGCPSSLGTLSSYGSFLLALCRENVAHETVPSSPLVDFVELVLFFWLAAICGR